MNMPYNKSLHGPTGACHGPCKGGNSRARRAVASELKRWASSWPKRQIWVLCQVIESAIIGRMSRSAVDIESLDIEERLRLLGALWDSLSDHPDKIPLTTEQQVELNARLDRIDAGDTAGIPWAEVLRQVQGRIE